MMSKSEENKVKKTLAFIGNQTKKVGVKVAYVALLLIYAYKRKETPRWAKNIVLGALAYLLTPLDFIPDLTPFLGFTDDFSILTAAIGSITMYINDDVKNQATTKLKTWFPSSGEDELNEINSKL